MKAGDVNVSNAALNVLYSPLYKYMPDTGQTHLKEEHN